MTNNRNCTQGCRTAATAEVGRCCWRKAHVDCHHCRLSRHSRHDTFHVFLQVHETRFLLLLSAGHPEDRAVPLSRSNCQPLIFIQVRDAARGLMASLSAFKDDCLPCATEVPTDVNVFCFAIAIERIQWVALWQRHSATAELVAEPSHEPRNVFDTQPQRARARGKQSDVPLFRLVWVGYKLVLWHGDSVDFVLPALRGVIFPPWPLALLR